MISKTRRLKINMKITFIQTWTCVYRLILSVICFSHEEINSSIGQNDLLQVAKISGMLHQYVWGVKHTLMKSVCGS